jgi:hypothetical protein
MAKPNRPLPKAPAGSTFAAVSRFVHPGDGYDPVALRAWFDAYPIPAAYYGGVAGPAEDEATGAVESLRDLWRTFARTDAEVEADQAHAASFSDLMMLAVHDGLRRYLRSRITEWSDEPPHRADFGRGMLSTFLATLAWVEGRKA